MHRPGADREQDGDDYCASDKWSIAGLFDVPRRIRTGRWAKRIVRHDSSFWSTRFGISTLGGNVRFLRDARGYRDAKKRCPIFLERIPIGSNRDAL